MQLELCAAAGGCRRIPAKKLQRWPGGCGEGLLLKDFQEVAGKDGCGNLRLQQAAGKDPC